jgi:hypothetical protein
MEFRPVARNSDLLVRRFDDEVIVYDLITNNALYLNETSANIWKLCDGHRSVMDIRRELREKFKTEVSTDYVLFAIYRLRQDQLISDEDDIDIYLKKSWGRRTTKRRYGRGSLMVLPRISSVIAPTAVAASCLAVPPHYGARKTV